MIFCVLGEPNYSADIDRLSPTQIGMDLLARYSLRFGNFLDTTTSETTLSPRSLRAMPAKAATTARDLCDLTRAAYITKFMENAYRSSTGMGRHELL